MEPWAYILWWLGAYLVGAVPFGLMLGYLRGVDIRKLGSGNVGATNVGRVLGRKLGLLCFVLDVLKGLAPVLAYGLATGAMHAVRGHSDAHIAVIDEGQAVIISTPADLGALASLLWLGIAAAAVLGHVFPVWLRFKGGKGVATSLGVLLGVYPYLTIPAVLAFVAWFATVKISGYVGLASVVAAALLPVLTAVSCKALGLGNAPTGVFFGITALLAVLVIFRHRGNIQRIRAGTEPRAGWAGKSE